MTRTVFVLKHRRTRMFLALVADANQSVAYYTGYRVGWVASDKHAMAWSTEEAAREFARLAGVECDPCPAEGEFPDPPEEGSE